MQFVGDTVLSLGSAMVMLMTLYSELPGRPGGENVVRYEISHGLGEPAATTE
jgi:hypothetical protein